jgi:hypothetical protein
MQQRQRRVRRSLMFLIGVIAPLVAASADAPKPSARPKSPNQTATLTKTGELRAENITDTEVREVQKIIAERSPGTITRIGAVTVGCNCGELAACTSHVLIDVKREKTMSVVLLARVKGTWQVSEGQSWQWRVDNWKANRRLLSKVPRENLKAYLDELERERLLIEKDAPHCPGIEKLYPVF